MEDEKIFCNFTRHGSRTCHVCGDTARGLNFNVMACMSCKSFFRRNAHKQSVSLIYVYKNNTIILTNCIARNSLSLSK